MAPFRTIRGGANDRTPPTSGARPPPVLAPRLATRMTRRRTSPIRKRTRSSLRSTCGRRSPTSPSCLATAMPMSSFSAAVREAARTREAPARWAAGARSGRAAANTSSTWKPAWSAGTCRDVSTSLAASGWPPSSTKSDTCLALATAATTTALSTRQPSSSAPTTRRCGRRCPTSASICATEQHFATVTTTPTRTGAPTATIFPEVGSHARLTPGCRWTWSRFRDFTERPSRRRSTAERCSASTATLAADSRGSSISPTIRLRSLLYSVPGPTTRSTFRASPRRPGSISSTALSVVPPDWSTT